MVGRNTSNSTPPTAATNLSFRRTTAIATLLPLKGTNTASPRASNRPEAGFEENVKWDDTEQENWITSDTWSLDPLLSIFPNC
jgi:hypothetical protein